MGFIIGYLKLVDTNKHHIPLRCCNEEIYFQIDFSEEESLLTGFNRFPSDGIYVCIKCNDRHDLNHLLEMLSEEFFNSEDES